MLGELFNTTCMNNNRVEAHIAAYATASPAKFDVESTLERACQYRRNRGQSEETIKFYKRVSDGTGIRKKGCCLYNFHEGTENADHIAMGKASGSPAEVERDISHIGYSQAERARLFDHFAVKLSMESAQKALNKWSGDVSEITHIICTTNAGWVLPGIGTHLISKLGLPLDTCKIEAPFNGCNGGLTILRTARDMVEASRPGERRVALVVATELSSINYNPDRDGKDDLITEVLFGDGSGAFIIAPEGDWKMTGNGCALIEDTMHVVGLKPHGPQAHLTRDNIDSSYMPLLPTLPGIIGKYFNEGFGSTMMKKALGMRSDQTQLPSLAVHPGGPAILKNLQDVLVKSYGFDPKSTDASLKVLQENGNLACAAIMFVLEHQLDTVEGNDMLVLAFGPGVTVEWGCLQRVVPAAHAA